MWLVATISDSTDTDNFHHHKNILEKIHLKLTFRWDFMNNLKYVLIIEYRIYFPELTLMHKHSILMTWTQNIHIPSNVFQQ